MPYPEDVHIVIASGTCDFRGDNVESAVGVSLDPFERFMALRKKAAITCPEPGEKSCSSSRQGLSAGLLSSPSTEEYCLLYNRLHLCG